MYRFVICVDLEASSLEDAYSRLCAAMGKVEVSTQGSIQWESTDEAYDPDGFEVDADKLSDARMAVLGRNG